MLWQNERAFLNLNIPVVLFLFFLDEFYQRTILVCFDGVKHRDEDKIAHARNQIVMENIVLLIVLAKRLKVRPPLLRNLKIISHENKNSEGRSKS